MKLIAITAIRRGIKEGDKDATQTIAEGESFEAEQQQAERLIKYGAAKADDSKSGRTTAAAQPA